MDASTNAQKPKESFMKYSNLANTVSNQRQGPVDLCDADR